MRPARTRPAGADLGPWQNCWAVYAGTVVTDTPFKVALKPETELGFVQSRGDAKWSYRFAQTYLLCPDSCRDSGHTTRPRSAKAQSRCAPARCAGPLGACGRGRGAAAMRFLGRLRGTCSLAVCRSRCARPGLMRWPSRLRKMRMRR